MRKMLRHEAEAYWNARKLLKTMLTLQDKAGTGPKSEERAALELAIEALTFAGTRLDNRPLTYTHMKQMHGQPVYCDSFYSGQYGGGILNAKKEETILLDHDGVWCDTWAWHRYGTFFRFPLNGVDLLTGGGKDTY